MALVTLYPLQVLGTLASLTVAGNNQFNSPIAFMFLGLLIVCNVSQVVVLTLSLKKFPALFIVVRTCTCFHRPRLVPRPHAPVLYNLILSGPNLLPPSPQPAYQVFMMVFSIAVGGIYFREFWMLSEVQWVLFLLGVGLCVGGVVVLSKADAEQNPSTLYDPPERPRARLLDGAEGGNLRPSSGTSDSDSIELTTQEPKTLVSSTLELVENPINVTAA